MSTRQLAKRLRADVAGLRAQIDALSQGGATKLLSKNAREFRPSTNPGTGGLEELVVEEQRSPVPEALMLTASEIEGEEEVFLNVGSSHVIKCIVTSPQPPDHIFWYFQHQVQFYLHIYLNAGVFTNNLAFLLQKPPHVTSV